MAINEYGIDEDAWAAASKAAADCVASYNSFDYSQLSGGQVTYGPLVATDTSGITWNPPLRCSHVLGPEAELVDGRIQGTCVTCGDTISGRRLPGGLGLLTLKAALVEAIGDPGTLPALADELERVELLLQLEEQTIEDGRRLIETARQMLLGMMTRD